MSQLSTIVDHSALGVALSGLLYAVGTLAAALTALLAPSPARRRDARQVLALLLRRKAGEDDR
ncbi:hypothetical protein GCM10010168_81050 [Actinoplanes ianthinogenes]|uniref:Uncharacterized protein n=1 Tax=Actinoplanes ianthinogenes TaxID=122358 RepID=A0ABM7LMQ6_9ACTN|nr:hypothetical protein [Actinoplanes ianthinogenes]BCJ40561.1 hypothetical protein Aiant_12180 [Actinoplanes ianthinogenes]GGR50078.1 hypothetical protein GCM10010168_81050 [Actinoplanes ianthinogenes]